MTTTIRQITHPGATARDRITARPCEAVPVRVTLRAGQSLAVAVPQAMAEAGFSFGYLRLDGAVFAPLVFVTPAASPDERHAAWYSETYSLPSSAQIQHAGVHLGQRDGAPFLHCHGIWDRRGTLPDAGHLLCDQSILACDCTVSGWGINGAALLSREDTETNFKLFSPEAQAPAAWHNAFLVTLRPNQDIGAALATFAQRHNIRQAHIAGIGSLVGTVFADGTVISSLATEILILSGQLRGPSVALQVVSVGMDGRACTGLLAPDLNAVCVTAEILLISDS